MILGTAALPQHYHVLHSRCGQRWRSAPDFRYAVRGRVEDEAMCGRVFVKTGVDGLLRAFAFAREGEAKALDNALPRFTAPPARTTRSPSGEPDIGGGTFMRARWGLIPRCIKEPKGGPQPINCSSERIATAPMFRSVYRARRALLPIDGFFEWRAIKGEKSKQPYAVAMADGSPFALAAIWETWRHPETGEDIRTFAVVTCPANKPVDCGRS